MIQFVSLMNYFSFALIPCILHTRIQVFQSHFTSPVYQQHLTKFHPLTTLQEKTKQNKYKLRCVKYQFILVNLAKKRFFVLFLFLFLLLFCFLTNSHCVSFGLVWNLLCGPGWPGTNRYPPASAFQVIWLKVCTTISSLRLPFESRNSGAFEYLGFRRLLGSSLPVGGHWSSGPWHL